MRSESSYVKILSERDALGLHVVNMNIHHTGTDACITVVTDANGVKYIVKQIPDGSIDEQCLLISDAFCASIGYQCGVSVNDATFIPYNIGNHVKQYPNQAAILLTYIEGTDLETVFPPFLRQLNDEFTIHQRTIKPNAPWQKHPPKDKEQGLTKDIIIHMSDHEDLPPIVALDTFVGNSDRSNPNILYDPQTGRFWGIDLAAGLHSPTLALCGFERLEELLSTNFLQTTNNKIWEGLNRFKNTLQTLVNHVDLVIAEKTLFDLASLLGPEALNNQDVKDRIIYFNSVLKKNVFNCRKIITLLNTVPR